MDEWTNVLPNEMDQWTELYGGERLKADEFKAAPLIAGGTNGRSCREVKQRTGHGLHDGQAGEELLLGDPAIRPGHLRVAGTHGAGGGRQHQRTVA